MWVCRALQAHTSPCPIVLAYFNCQQSRRNELFPSSHISPGHSMSQDAMTPCNPHSSGCSDLFVSTGAKEPPQNCPSTALHCGFFDVYKKLHIHCQYSQKGHWGISGVSFIYWLLQSLQKCRLFETTRPWSSWVEASQQVQNLFLYFVRLQGANHNASWVTIRLFQLMLKDRTYRQ